MLNLGCVFPLYCSEAGLGHIFLSLCRNWNSEPMQARILVPNIAEPFRGDSVIEAVPHPLQWLAYRSTSWPRILTEMRLLRSLPRFDALYAFPDISVRTLGRIKTHGKPIILERVNCFGGKRRQLMEREYRRLGAAPPRPFEKWAVDAEREAVAIADFLFCPSPEVETSFLEAGLSPGKLISSSYGWSPERFPQTADPRPPREAVTVLFAGTVCIRKGAHLLLDAWQRAAISGRLVLCGPIEPALQRLFGELLARPDVVHIPYASDMGRFYREADIFAFPSIEEGGPLVTYEAMAHGLAVVASPMGAGAVLRNGIDGLVIPPHSADGWVDALRSLAQSPECRLRFGEAARVRAQDFTWAKVARRRADALTEKLNNARL